MSNLLEFKIPPQNKERLAMVYSDNLVTLPVEEKAIDYVDLLLNEFADLSDCDIPSHLQEEDEESEIECLLVDASTEDEYNSQSEYTTLVSFIKSKTRTK